MGGHLDDGEPDQERPIVSYSLGLSCVFLAGGRVKEDPPIAVKLNSGDLVVMGGEARRVFHGVPKVFPDSGPLFTNLPDFSNEKGQNSRKNAENFLREFRINLNFRQVEP